MTSELLRNRKSKNVLLDLGITPELLRNAFKPVKLPCPMAWPCRFHIRLSMPWPLEEVHVSPFFPCLATFPIPYAPCPEMKRPGDLGHPVTGPVKRL
jgi:hypothetical protein